MAVEDVAGVVLDMMGLYSLTATKASMDTVSGTPSVLLLISHSADSRGANDVDRPLPP